MLDKDYAETSDVNEIEVLGVIDIRNDVKFFMDKFYLREMNEVICVSFLEKARPREEWRIVREILYTEEEVNFHKIDWDVCDGEIIFNLGFGSELDGKWKHEFHVYSEVTGRLLRIMISMTTNNDGCQTISVVHGAFPGMKLNRKANTTFKFTRYDNLISHLEQRSRCRVCLYTAQTGHVKIKTHCFGHYHYHKDGRKRPCRQIHSTEDSETDHYDFDIVSLSLITSSSCVDEKNQGTQFLDVHFGVAEHVLFLNGRLFTFITEQNLNEPFHSIRMSTKSFLMPELLCISMVHGSDVEIHFT